MNTKKISSRLFYQLKGESNHLSGIFEDADKAIHCRGLNSANQSRR